MKISLSNNTHENYDYFIHLSLVRKQGRKRPLDTPKKMIKRREREGKREKER
jgi:hypothetical protein